MPEETVQHIEDISRDMVKAVNERDFSTSSTLWSHMSNRFRGDLEQYRASGETHAKVGPTELEEHFDTFRKIVQDHPEYYQKILSLDTAVESKAGTAEVLVHSEVTGPPAGIVRETMSVFGFRRIDGKWLCRKLQVICIDALSVLAGSQWYIDPAQSWVKTNIVVSCPFATMFENRILIIKAAFASA